MLQAYLFNDYWEDIGTIRSFFEANLALTAHVSTKKHTFLLRKHFGSTESKSTERSLFDKFQIFPFAFFSPQDLVSMMQISRCTHREEIYHQQRLTIARSVIFYVSVCEEAF